MNHTSIMQLLVLIPVLAQGAPEESQSSDSTNRAQGSSPWILLAATAVAGGCYWAYHHWSPAQEATQAETNFKNCLRDYLDSPINSNGIPRQCTSVALNHALKCEEIGEESRIQIMLDSFKRRR